VAFLRVGWELAGLPGAPPLTPVIPAANLASAQPGALRPAMTSEAPVMRTRSPEATPVANAYQGENVSPNRGNPLSLRPHVSQSQLEEPASVASHDEINVPFPEQSRVDEPDAGKRCEELSERGTGINEREVGFKE